MSTLDDRLRTRLAEIRASAGVPHAQLALEVLYFLPKGFLDAYANLFTTAVKADSGESARNQSQQDAGELGKARGNGAKPGRRYKKSWIVQDEKALQLKDRVDKRLRAMAGDIAGELAGGDGPAHQANCVGCRTFLQVNWRYCPRCGKDRVE